MSNSSAQDAMKNKMGDLRKGEFEAITKIANVANVTEKKCDVEKRTIKVINGVEMFDGKCAQWEKIAPAIIKKLSEFATSNKMDPTEFLLNLAMFLDGNATSIRAAAADLAFDITADGKKERYSLNSLAQATGVMKVAAGNFDKMDVNEITWAKIHKVLYAYKAKFIEACEAKGNTAVINRLTKSDWTNLKIEGMTPFANPYAYLYVPAGLRTSWLKGLETWAHGHANSVTKASGVSKRSAASWVYSANTFFNGYVSPLDVSTF